MAVAVNADRVVLHAREDVVVALVGLPWDIIGIAVIQAGVALGSSKRGRQWEDDTDGTN